MKEIEFRGKRVDGCGWVYGSLIIDYITGKYYIHPSGNCVNESEKIGYEGCLYIVSFEVHPNSIGQYVKIKDKYKNKIFQGDLIEITYFSYEQPECSAVFLISYEEMSFCLEFKYGRCYTSPYSEEWLIIGNIHDNPELLEGGHNVSDGKINKCCR